MSDLPTLIFEQAPPTPDTFNVMLFGPIGSGKTTAAARLAALGDILWMNLEGGGALANARKIAGDRILEVRLSTVDVRKPSDDAGVDPTAILREFVRYAKIGDPATGIKPATVVIDTIGKLRDALAAQYVVPRARDSRDQWGEVAKILRAAIGTLRDLPVNLVLLAHHDITEDDGDGRLVRPKIGGALTEDIPAELDVVAYTTATVEQPDENDPSTRRKAYYGQLVDGKGRTGLKDRSDALGLYRTLDLAEWRDTYCASFASDDSDLPFTTTTDTLDDAIVAGAVQTEAA